MWKSFDRGILAGIALVIALIVATAGINYRNTNLLDANAARVAESHRVLELTAAVMQGMLDTETGERGYLLTTSDEYLVPYTNALPRIPENLNRLKEVTRDNPEQFERVARLEEMSRDRLDLLKRLIAARRLNKRNIDPLDAARKGKQRMDEIRSVVAEIDQAERVLLAERQEASRRAYRIAIATGLFSTFLGLVSVAAFIWLLDRTLSARQQTAATMYEQRELFRTTLASIGDGVFATDMKGKITFLNAVAADLTGWKTDEAQGQPLEKILQVVSEDGHKPMENAATQVLREGKAVSRSNQNLMLDRQGHETPIDESAAPIRTRDGIMAGAVLVVRNVAELRRSERALREADRLKDEYLAMLAHELRNPLAPIRNSLHIMKFAGEKSDLLGPAREMAERQVKHMARLLDDLLDVSRISRGKIELRCELVDVVSLAERTLESVRPLIEEPRHEIITSLSTKPVMVEGDPTRIEQILTNLLNNAAKYTEPGGTIWLTVGEEDGKAVVRVRDTGIGIAPDMLSHVFDLFVQCRRSTDPPMGGVGIGLTLVRKLVELHHGSVEALSAGLNKGSEFVVRLPTVGVSSKTKPSSPAPVMFDKRAPKHRILVVDDNVDAAESLALLLRMKGQEVRVAFDGPGAITAAHDFSPEAVFLDIGMPGMDGYEVARRLRHELRASSVVLLALTGWGQQEDKRRAAEAGFDHHLTKPVEPSALENLLASIH